jgi:hypothetical protein
MRGGFTFRNWKPSLKVHPSQGKRSEQLGVAASLGARRSVRIRAVFRVGCRTFYPENMHAVVKLSLMILFQSLASFTFEIIQKPLEAHYLSRVTHLTVTVTDGHGHGTFILATHPEGI